jgi:hypothetical protein
VPARNRLVAESTEANEAATEITPEAFEALRAEKEALIANRNEVLKEAKAAKAKLARYSEIDPDEYKTLKTQAEEAERKRLEAVGDWKAREAQLLEKVGKDIEAKESRIKALESYRERMLVDAKATEALAAAKGSIKVLLPHIKAHIRVVEEDGEATVHIVDDKGNVRIGDSKMNPMTIAQFVEEMKSDPEFARNFEGSGSSGGGATKSNAGGGGVKTIQKGDQAAFLANLDDIIAGNVKVA